MFIFYSLYILTHNLHALSALEYQKMEAFQDLL